MKPQTLDYRAPTPPTTTVRKSKWGPPPNDPESNQWRLYRSLYYISLSVLFLPVALWFGPNVIAFGKLSRPTPADFIPSVKQNGVPLVTAIKSYERDTGNLPNDLNDLVPKYLAKKIGWGIDFSSDTQKLWFYRQLYNEAVLYDFAPTQEGWKVHGYFVDGPLPMPLVTVAPNLHP